MPFTGSAPNKSFQRSNGTYSGTSTWAQDDANGFAIVSTRHDTHDQDMATAINTSLQTDGANKMAAGLPGYDGTVSLPGYAFSGDLNSGMYRIGSDNVGFAAGGVKIFEISTSYLTMNKPIVATAGSTSAPSVAFSGDTDTGLYSPGADQVSIAAGGADVFAGTTTTATISAGGSAVITATTTAVTIAKPILAPDGSTSAPSVTNTGDTDTGLFFPAANQVALVAGGVLIGAASTTALTMSKPIITAGVYPAFRAYKTSNTSGLSSSFTKLTFNAESFDTTSDFASSRFTPSVEGYYDIKGHITGVLDGEKDSFTFQLAIYKNGSAIHYNRWRDPTGSATLFNLSVNELVYMNGSTDYVELYYSFDYTGPQTYNPDDVYIAGGTAYNMFSGVLVLPA